MFSSFRLNIAFASSANLIKNINLRSRCEIPHEKIEFISVYNYFKPKNYFTLVLNYLLFNFKSEMLVRVLIRFKT